MHVVLVHYSSDGVMGAPTLDALTRASPQARSIPLDPRPNQVRPWGDRPDALVVLVGPDWAARLHGDDPESVKLRALLKRALSEGSRVVPVLLGQTDPPDRAALPHGLAPLAFRNAVRIRPGADLAADLQRLVRTLTHAEAPLPEPEVPPTPKGQVAKRAAGVVVVFVVAAAITGFSLLTGASMFGPAEGLLCGAVGLLFGGAFVLVALVVNRRRAARR